MIKMEKKISRENATKLLGELVLVLGLKVEFPVITLSITENEIHVEKHAVVVGEQ